MNTLTNSQRVLIAALLGFIIGAGAIWVWNVSTQRAEAPTESEELATEKENEDEETVSSGTSVATTKASVAERGTSVATGETISVPAQAAGSSVRFTASFSNPGWVVIHEDRNGSMGNALGARWLSAGVHENSVELLRNTVSGQTYHAVMYSDDGDKEFELKTETLIVGADGKNIATSFKVE